MPNYRTHDAINLTALGVTYASYTILANASVIPNISGVAMLGYTLSYLAGTFFVTPDLDLHGSKPKKRWGALRILWHPYATLVPHRSSFSHGWLIGPLTRLLYLLLFTLPPLAATRTLEPIRAFMHQHIGWDALIAVLAGYLVSQWMHLIADRATLRP